MIKIKGKSYSLESLKETCNKKFRKNNLEEWEASLWIFLTIWFDKTTEEIEIKTSGSTGKPKTIYHKKKYMLASAFTTCKHFELDNTKTALLCLPTTSIGGMMMLVRALVSGMNLIIEKPSSKPLKNLKENIDFIAMVPMQAQESIAENIEKWSFIKTVIIGGGKVSNSLEKDIINNKINAYSTFGMTETISHIAINKIGENKIYQALENCFFSLKNNCLIITAKHLGIEKLETNDLVNLIDSKNFIWLGRTDNAVETGGVKVLPEVVEQKIAHLFTGRFFVSSLPDKTLNNKLILLVENVDCKITIENLKFFLKKYECPKEMYFLNTFVNTKNGKLDRQASVNCI